MGNNIFRFLGFFFTAKQFIVCHGFAKKSQKVPPKEIELAENRKKLYLERRRMR